jgi:hypothetical protein
MGSMKIDELDAELPNGLHDARVLSFVYLEEEHRVEFVLEIWTGDLHAKSHSERERYDRARLELLGVDYFDVEEPHPGFLPPGSKPVRIDNCGPDERRGPRRPIPYDLFAGRFYVFDWNSFIEFAAKDVRLTWLGAN